MEMGERFGAMKTGPLVSIICTTYNHSKFIEETLNHVHNISYSPIELLIVDNCSSDDTVLKIKDWIQSHQDTISILTFSNETPLPYCECFMHVIQSAKGKYFIDLAGDDLILKNHLTLSIQLLEKFEEAAFCFSDAWMEKSTALKSFYSNSSFSFTEQNPVLGLFPKIVRGNPILSATLVFNRSHFLAEGGYDTSLAYEDFDIMVRLSRKYPLVFSSHLGVIKRIHAEAFSKQQYFPKTSKMLPSTLKICHKLVKMIQSEEEKEALKFRIKHELKHAVWSANFDVANGFIHLLTQLDDQSKLLLIYKIWIKSKLNLARIYRIITSN
jgi:glycosyltransferase involved in cell wall biosynthesis